MKGDVNMQNIPAETLETCARAGSVRSIRYGDKYVLLYTPSAKAEHILYLIHGGGGTQHSFFRPAFLNMVDHMTESGMLEPLYIVAPCFYAPGVTDKRPGTSGVAVKQFCSELREQIIPRVERHIGMTFERESRAIGGFSMGGVTTWYAFMQALDLFYWFVPLSGDCWALGETGGGLALDETAECLAQAAIAQGLPDFRIHAVTGARDIAFPNLDPQIRAMEKHEDVFGKTLRYDVLEDGVHDYETIFRYLYNVLPELFKR